MVKKKYGNYAKAPRPPSHYQKEPKSIPIDKTTDLDKLIACFKSLGIAHIVKDFKSPITGVDIFKHVVFGYHGYDECILVFSLDGKYLKQRDDYFDDTITLSEYIDEHVRNCKRKDKPIY